MKIKFYTAPQVCSSHIVLEKGFQNSVGGDVEDYGDGGAYQW